MMLAYLNDMSLGDLLGMLGGNPGDLFPPVEPLPTEN